MYQYNSETPDPETERQEALQLAKDIVGLRQQILSKRRETGDTSVLEEQLSSKENQLGLKYRKPPVITFLRFEIEGPINEKWEQTKNIVVVPNPGAQGREDPQSYTVSLLGNGKNIPDKRIVIVSNPLPNVLI